MHGCDEDLRPSRRPPSGPAGTIAPIALLLLVIAAPGAAAQEERPLVRWTFDAGQVQSGRLKAVEGKLASGRARVLGDPRFEKLGELGICRLDGKDDSVLVSEGPPPRGLPRREISVEAWVRIDEEAVWGAMVGAVQDDAGTEKGWLLGNYASHFSFALSTEGADDGDGKLSHLLAPTPFELGRWYHVVGTFGGAEQRIYVDGELAHTSSEQSGDILYPEELFVELGAYHDGNEHHRLNGALHEVALWGRALSPVEIAARHRAKVGRLRGAAGPVRSWSAELAADPSWESRLRNGGGESPGSMSRLTDEGFELKEPAGWTVTRGQWFVAPSGRSDLEAAEGMRFLTAGEAAEARLVQEVELERAVGGSAVFAVASASLRDWEGKDGGALRLVALDSGGRPLCSATTGLLRSITWTAKAVGLRLPPRARGVRVELAAERAAGAWCDGYFDDVELQVGGAAAFEGALELGWEELWRRVRSIPLTRERDLLEACAALVLADPARAADAFERAHEGAARASERELYLRGLAMCGGARAAEALERVMEDSERRDDLLAAIRIADSLPESMQGAILSLAARFADRKVRAAALEAAQARDPEGALPAIKALYRREDPALRAALLRAVRPHHPASAVYGTMLAPNLETDAAADLRHLAMDHLAASGDPRFFGHLRELYRSASSSHRSRWLSWCTRFDEVIALQEMLELVEAPEELTGCPRGEHACDRYPGRRVQHAEPAVLDRTFLEMAAGMESEGASRWARTRGLRHRHPIGRLGALRQILSHPREGDLALLLRLARDRAVEVAVAALAAHPGPEAEALLEDVMARGEAELAALALRTLWGMRGGSADMVDLTLEVGYGSRSWQMRQTALELLAGEHAREARDAALANFGHPHREVRMAAFRLVAELREPASVDLLLEQLDGEVGAARFELARGLADLTGRNWGASFERWTAWWSGVREGFVLPLRRERSAEPGLRTRSYYGVPILGDNVVFLIDLSGSMAAKVDGQTRLRRAQDELIETLRSLERPMRFNIVVFSDYPELYQKGLVSAGKVETEKAVAWVERLTHHPLWAGWTNIYDSLAMSLEMEEVEVVFLLSDGGASVGALTGAAEIRSAIREQNRHLRVVIHTIGIGDSDSMDSLLRGLAADNRGRYVKAGK